MTPEQRERHLARCRAYYQANKARLVALQSQKRKENPDSRKAHDAAYRKRHAEKVKAAKEAYKLKYPERVLATKKRWRETNPEKMERARQRWNENNPERKRLHRENRRARERNAAGRMSPGIVQRLLELQQHRCATCRIELRAELVSTWYRTNYELDHRIPLFRGGSNDDSNAQLLCRTCNRSKRTKLPHEFRPDVVHV